MRSSILATIALSSEISLRRRSYFEAVPAWAGLETCSCNCVESCEYTAPAEKAAPTATSTAPIGTQYARKFPPPSRAVIFVFI